MQRRAETVYGIMKDLIKEIAFLHGIPEDKATAFLAELSKRADASCVAFQHEDTGRTTSVAHDEADAFERLNQRWFKVGPLFTFPPIHDIDAAITNCNNKEK